MRDALIKMGFNDNLEIVYGYSDFDIKAYKISFKGTEGNISNFTFNLTGLTVDSN
jgi:hypothetical protein